MLGRISLSLLIGSLSFTPVFANHSNNLSTHTSPTQQTKKDAEALGLLIALNNNEINSGKDAVQKSNNASVKDYAEMMVKEHSANLEETIELSKKLNIQPATTAKVKTLSKAGENELKKLSPLNGESFDKAYISIMIKDHKEALKILDKEIKLVKNIELKSHLQETRKHVEHHLDAAKEI